MDAAQMGKTRRGEALQDLALGTRGDCDCITITEYGVPNDVCMVTGTVSRPRSYYMVAGSLVVLRGADVGQLKPWTSRRSA